MRETNRRPAIPRTVWALGLVSLFMDMSSELVHSLLPVFLVTTLGAGALGVGVAMSLFYAISAYPAGILSDRLGRRSLLATGLGLLILADVVLAGARSPAWVLAGASVWGLHMGFSQGIPATMVADHSPPDLKGTAFGLFNLAGGVCLFLASLLAGWLWVRFGAPATFYTGAGIAAAALLLCAVGGRDQRVAERREKDALG